MMGTRADFYVGRGLGAKWLGSIAFDGYPKGIDDDVLAADTEDGFVAALREQAKNDPTWTQPEQGWPWPWNDSATTDYAYAFDAGKVWASCFGGPWFDPLLPEPDNQNGTSAVFPDMSDIQNVTMGPRSGLIVMTMK